VAFIRRRNYFQILIALSVLAFTFSGACNTIFLFKTPQPVPVEFNFPTPSPFLASTPVDPVKEAVVVHTFPTNSRVWEFNSSDPSGITYDSSTGNLIIVDSEVDETEPICSKPNVFYLSTAGSLVNVVNTCTREYHFMKEPTGIDFNDANGHIFISDDDQNSIFEIAPGTDNLYWTLDDIVVKKDLTGLGYDEEDLTVFGNRVYVANGLNGGYLRFDLGADGILSGDDGKLELFSTLAYGFSDVEGITHSPDGQSIFIVSTKGTDRHLGEFSPDGDLENKWDLSFMGRMPNIRSGLTFGPGSLDPTAFSLYIVSRGFDNNVSLGTPFPANPTEDDGKVWEISLNPD